MARDSCYLLCMINITFKTEEELVSKARIKAKIEKRSLNDVFNEWLNVYTYPDQKKQNYSKIMKHLSYVHSGRKCSREEMNER